MSERHFWYDRDLNPITVEEADELLRRGDSRQVVMDKYPDGWVVSTVFLVIDHNWGEGPPILFETMIFTPEGEPAAQRRYATEDQAVAGHDQLSAMIRDRGGLK